MGWQHEGLKFALRVLRESVLYCSLYNFLRRFYPRKLKNHFHLQNSYHKRCLRHICFFNDFSVHFACPALSNFRPSVTTSQPLLPADFFCGKCKKAFPRPGNSGYIKTSPPVRAKQLMNIHYNTNRLQYKELKFNKNTYWATETFEVNLCPCVWNFNIVA